MGRKKDILIKPILYDKHFRKLLNKLYNKKSRNKAKQVIYNEINNKD